MNRIVATPDDVARLDTIRCAPVSHTGCCSPGLTLHSSPRSADAVTRRLNAEAALSSALGAQVAETMSGRSRLEACQEALRLLQQRFREIDALCVECRDLVQHDDVIRQLSTVRANFEATLSKVVTILDLPEEAAQTLASLEQESELVVVYEELVALDAKCAAAQRLFEDGAMQTAQQRSKASSRARNEELKSRVASYFQKVDAARFTFEDRMWAQLKEAVHLGDSGSATCVRVLRVVQEQEAMDRDRAKQKPGTALPWAPRKYRQLAVQAVEAAVDERCARLLPEHLVPPDGEDSVVMAEVLLDVQECFRGLEARVLPCALQASHSFSLEAHLLVAAASLRTQDIYDFIVPCFPEDYGMWEARACVACTTPGRVPDSHLAPWMPNLPRCLCGATTSAWFSSTTGSAPWARRPATATSWTWCALTRSTPPCWRT